MTEKEKAELLACWGRMPLSYEEYASRSTALFAHYMDGQLSNMK